MDYLTATKAIIKFFAQGWNKATPVAYPDDAFNIPDGQTWARLTVQHYDARQASTGAPGSNRHRRDGLVTIQIFAVEKNAALDALAKADMAVNLFLNATYNDIRFFEAQAKEIGPDGAGWHQVNVLAYFQYDRLA